MAIFLFVNGLVLFAAEFLRKKRASSRAPDADGAISKLSWSQSFKVGVAQALALNPGFSRTGAALSGGLLVGLSHEDAARFAFLLATPLIGAAALLKLPHFLLHIHSYPAGPILAGALAAAIFAWLSIAFLVRYFKTKTLTPFATYCVLAGLACAAILFFQVGQNPIRALEGPLPRVPAPRTSR